MHMAHIINTYYLYHMNIIIHIKKLFIKIYEVSNFIIRIKKNHHIWKSDQISLLQKRDIRFY